MEEATRQALIDVIGRFGRSVCDDPRRCKALLLDMCPQHGREIRVLIGALQERVPQSLQSSSASDVPLTVKIPQLATHLHRELALAEDAARWAVESWALALGLETPSQLASVTTNREATPHSLSGYSFEEAPPPGLGGSALTPPSQPPSPPPVPPRKQTSGRRSFLLGLILLAFCAASY